MNGSNELLRTWVVRLIIINAVVFAIQYLTARMHIIDPTFQYIGPSVPVATHFFGLSPHTILDKLYFWQFFSYMFLHSTASFFHILFNMYALFIFGRPLEEAWGSKRFLFYYFFTGIGAGICIFALNTLIGGANYEIPTIGASGAVFGILLAFGIMYPNVELFILFIPVPIKAKYFVIFYGAIEVFSLFSSGGHGSISHIGHVGGLIFGLIFFFFQRKKGLTFKSKLIRAKFDKNKNQDSIREVKEVGTHVKVKETDKTRLLNILKKAKTGGADALSDDEFQHLQYLEIMVEDDDDLCVEDDFDDIDEYCKKCTNYEACILREIKRYI